MVVPVLTEPVSSTGAEATVVTVSPTPVTDIGTSSVSLSATRISMFSRVVLAKPDAVTVSVYFPGLRSGKLKLPSSLVVTVLATLVSTFLISTVAPGRAAPFGSVTVPVSAPRDSCAPAATNVSRSNSTAETPRRNAYLLITLSSFSRLLAVERQLECAFTQGVYFCRSPKDDVSVCGAPTIIRSIGSESGKRPRP
jgi:hypothetical protein